MHAVDLTESLPLTCTREGTCCHGHFIWINPWELALLAQATGLSRRAFRDRHTECHGTRLRFQGPPGWQGKAACDLYAPGHGCTAHAGRPLACRMYPLGRARRQGAVIYHLAGAALPCLERCPSVVQLPQQSVGAYLQSQQIEAVSVATDAYANLVYGMVGVVKSLLDHGAQADIDAATILHSFEELVAMTPEQRTGLLPEEWVDFLTLLPDDADMADSAAAVRAHGEGINALVQQQMNRTGASLTDVAHLYLAMAFHLNATIGGDPAAMRELLVPVAAPAG